MAALRAAGYDTVEKVLAADPDELAALPGFDADTVDAVVAAATSQQARTSRRREPPSRRPKSRRLTEIDEQRQSDEPAR